MYYEQYSRSEFSRELRRRVKRLGLKPSYDEVVEFSEFIMKHYNIKCDVRVEYKPNKNAYNGGLYLDAGKKIIFYNELNLITVLHELRHYIQFNTSMIFVVDSYSKREDEARAWSSSLFYAVFPKQYLDMASKGLIKYV